MPFQAKMFSIEFGLSIIHHGKVFPIDLKQEEIPNEKSGVLSFAHVGMGEAMFHHAPEDEESKITVHYLITKSSASPRNVAELESKWQLQPTRFLTGSSRLMRTNDWESHSNSDSQERASSSEGYSPFNGWRSD